MPWTIVFLSVALFAASLILVPVVYSLVHRGDDRIGGRVGTAK